MNEITLSAEEKQMLNNYIEQVRSSEIAQAQDLFKNCNSSYQFAKTHSVFVRDWEKTKQLMENNLKNGVLPPDTSINLYQAIMDESDKIVQEKLKLVRSLFQLKFNESIYNYLGSDGKTKKLFGIFG